MQQLKNLINIKSEHGATLRPEYLLSLRVGLDSISKTR